MNKLLMGLWLETKTGFAYADDGFGQLVRVDYSVLAAYINY